MLEYIKTCYTILCEMIDSMFSVDKTQLEHENQMYCIMSDGDFLKHEKPQLQEKPQIKREYSPYRTVNK